jgi:heptosyltransferase-2/heptosyltransferase-3
MLRRVNIPDDLIVDVKDHPLLPGEHATQQWRRFARVMPDAMPRDMAQSSVPIGSGGCFLQVNQGQQADLVAWLESRRLASSRLIAIQMGNKRTMRRGLRRLAVNHKYWPLERWVSVLRHLRARHPEHAIVLLGTGPEFALNQELLTSADIDGVHNLADDLPVPRLAALLARADGLVTVDSGPAHAAAAVGCPQVVLFGKASTSLYRPWGISGADVKVLTGQLDGELTMLGIAVGAVTAAWDTLALREAPL